MAAGSHHYVKATPKLRVDKALGGLVTALRLFCGNEEDHAESRVVAGREKVRLLSEPIYKATPRRLAEITKSRRLGAAKFC